MGLEKTPEEYVAKMVAVFREVRRVLRDDGTLWLNLGDSYARQAGDDSTKCPDSGMKTGRTGRGEQLFKKGCNAPPAGLKPKDLVGIPWRVAFALQADGWYLRSDIIWSKPNPMPESVTDRPTKAHEYLFLLTKSERYFYDHEAIKEPAMGWNGSRFEDGKNLITHPNVGKKRNLGEKLSGADPAEIRAANGHKMGRGAGWRNDPANTPEARNKRSVWTVATQPYSEAHFATFPPKLIEPCILAGCPSGGLVLDPFAGSGTTIEVAQQLGRQGVGIELNPDYIALAEKRTAQTGLLL